MSVNPNGAAPPLAGVRVLAFTQLGAGPYAMTLLADLGADALRGANPRVGCSPLSGFGRTGPRAGEPGYDFILQAYAGFMSVTGEPDGPPTRSGVSVVDFAGGMLSALALMIGLHRARE